MIKQMFLEDGPAGAPGTVILAHGAGAPMQSAFMSRIARGLADRGIRVVRFNFPYMEAKRKVPDREPVLLARWREVIEHFGGGRRLVIGGKSLGGRMASMVADEVQARGLVCLGYPFHPPGRPQRLRTAHLRELRTPTLIVQGTRDPFGTRAEVEEFELSEAIRFKWIEDGDHSLNPRQKSAAATERNLTEVIDAVAEFVLSSS